MCRPFMLPQSPDQVWRARVKEAWHARLGDP
jgi:hypothetical protein